MRTPSPYFPRPTLASRLPTPTRADGTTPARPLVVLAYNDPAVLRALTFALEIEGYEVEACDGAEALLAFSLPDRRACLVLNQRLPPLTGLQAVRILRERNVRLPIILTVGKLRLSERYAATALGVGLVEKPLLGEVLLEAIGAAFAAQPSGA